MNMAFWYDLRLLLELSDVKRDDQRTLAPRQRFNPICGASDLHDDDLQGIRRLLRKFAARNDCKTEIGPSRGSNCMACGDKINVGEREFKISAGVFELRLDRTCYRLFMEEAAQGRSEPGDEQHLHELVVRMFAARGDVKTVSSAGKGDERCTLCGKAIKAGQAEYEIQSSGTKIRLDIACYRIFLQHSRRVRPDDRTLGES
jgi:hypothetical protein